MSYHIVKRVEILEDGKVFITGADNNVYPRTPRRWQCTYLDQFLTIEEKEVSILDAYESGNFQAGVPNKYTRALSVLRHMPEYRDFDWRVAEPDYTANNVNRTDKKEEFNNLLKKALNTPLPRTKYAITKTTYDGHTLYFRYRKGSLVCRWYIDPKKATIYRFKEDAENTIKTFMDSAGWRVVPA